MDSRFPDDPPFAAVLAVALATTAYVMFVTRTAFYDEIAQGCLRTRRPVHVLSVDGLPLLVIFQTQTKTPGGPS